MLEGVFILHYTIRNYSSKWNEMKLMDVWQIKHIFMCVCLYVNTHKWHDNFVLWDICIICMCVPAPHLRLSIKIDSSNSTKNTWKKWNFIWKAVIFSQQSNYGNSILNFSYYPLPILFGIKIWLSCRCWVFKCSIIIIEYV